VPPSISSGSYRFLSPAILLLLGVYYAAIGLAYAVQYYRTSFALAIWMQGLLAEFLFLVSPAVFAYLEFTTENPKQVPREYFYANTTSAVAVFILGVRLDRFTKPLTGLNSVVLTRSRR